MAALRGLYERLTSFTAWQTLSRRAALGLSKQAADLKSHFCTREVSDDGKGDY